MVNSSGNAVNLGLLFDVGVQVKWRFSAVACSATQSLT